MIMNEYNKALEQAVQRSCGIVALCGFQNPKQYGPNSALALL